MSVLEGGASYMIENYLDNAFIQWKGQELEYNKTLYLPTLIDLSSNRIEGNIPTEIFQMEGLMTLNLSRNNLRGGISPKVYQMEALECLDLSNNQLSDEIPAGLGTLSFLDFLDLSNKNFSGGTQLHGFNASAYVGNVGLCGDPLPGCPNDEPHPSSPHDHGKLDNGNDDVSTNQSFMHEFYIAMVLGFIVGFWGLIGTLRNHGDMPILHSLT